MEGVDLTKVLNKGKQMAGVATSANANGGKKRRKGTDLKPIVTNDATPGATESYVYFSQLSSPLPSFQLSPSSLPATSSYLHP